MSPAAPHPEADARAVIEAALTDAGWQVADDLTRSGPRNLAIRDFRVGEAAIDYGLLADGRLLGLVEVKTHGLPRAVVLQQTLRLARAVETEALVAETDERFFVYFTTGAETVLSEAPHAVTARDVRGFHRPATLERWASEPSLGDQVAAMAHDIEVPVHPLHTTALEGLDRTLAGDERRALVTLPTGIGRMTIAAAQSYRLLRNTSVRRVLVLVDRQDLAQQAAQTFSALPLAGGRRFADDFSVSVVTGSRGLPEADVLVMTVQRLHSLSSDEAHTDGRRLVIPTDTFDFIWADESHRLVSGRWGELLDYFDAPVVGLTATATPEALRFFDGNLLADIDVNELLQAGTAHEPTRRVAIDDVFRRADTYRGTHGSSEAILRALEDGDVHLSWRELSLLIGRATQLATWSPAPFVLDFLAAYLHERKADWAVDPRVSTPALLAAIVEANAAQRATGFVPSELTRTLARTLASDSRLDWTHDDAFAPAASKPPTIDAPDLIVCFPPLGMRTETPAPTVLVAPDLSRVELRDELGYRLLLDSGSRLADNGEAIFLVGDGFFTKRGPRRARSALAALELNVHAVVSVRQGFHSTNSPLSLIFVRREPVDAVFVAELGPQADFQQLASNVRSRRRGPVPALGRLVAWDAFRSYAHTAGAERVEALLAESGVEPTVLRDVLREPVLGPLREDEDFPPKPNAVYLPTYTSAVAHASREDLTSKPKGYLQLVLRPEVALAEYVATLLNTAVGRTLRESIASSGVRATVRRSEVDQLRLPLPHITVQQKVVEARGLIRNLRLELDGLERQLATQPDDVAQVVSALRELGQRDPLVSFRETLPFPLASVLWRYEADAEPKEKVEHLHRFFEAAAVYFATVLLSAFKANEGLFTLGVTRWSKKLRKGSFNRSSFGTWTIFGRLMTKSARGLLDGSSGQRERMVAAFSVGSERFADVVGGHTLWDLLDEAKDERNASKAHGGLSGPVVIQHMHARLSTLLTKLAELLVEPMSDVVLVRPGVNRYRRGIHRYEKAEMLQGSHNIFRQVPLEAMFLMEDDGLYLISSERRPADIALRMEPFFRLKPSPQSAENACYFFSELREDGVKFISHHFEGEPSFSAPDAEVVELIETLSTDSAGN